MSTESSKKPDAPKKVPVDPTDAFDRRRYATRLAATVARDLTARAAKLAAHRAAGNKRPGQGANIDEAGAVVLSIEGAWGSGKTHFIGLLKEEVEKAAKAASGPTLIWRTISIWEANDPDRVLDRFLAQVETALRARPAWYRRWWVALSLRAKREGLSRLRASLLLVLLAELALVWAFCLEDRWLEALSAVADYQAPAALALAATAAWRLAKNLFPELTKPSGPVSRGALLEGGTYGEMFEEAHEGDRPVYFVVDDLDRVEPAVVVQILGLIRRLSRIPWLVFIVAYEPAHLHSAVSTQLGVEDAQGFLAKLTNRRFALPLPSEERFGLWASNQLLAAMKEAAFKEATTLDEIVEPLLLDLRRSRTLNVLHTPRSVLVVARRIETEWHACLRVAYQPDVLVLAILLEAGPNGTDLSTIHRLVKAGRELTWQEVCFWFGQPAYEPSGNGSELEGPFTTGNSGPPGHQSVVRLEARVQSFRWWTDYHTNCLTLLASLLENGRGDRSIALGLCTGVSLTRRVPAAEELAERGEFRFGEMPRVFRSLETDPQPGYPITASAFFDGVRTRRFPSLASLPDTDALRSEIVAQWMVRFANELTNCEVQPPEILPPNLGQLWELQHEFVRLYQSLPVFKQRGSAAFITAFAIAVATRWRARRVAPNFPADQFRAGLESIFQTIGPANVDLWEVWRSSEFVRSVDDTPSQRILKADAPALAELTDWMRSHLLQRVAPASQAPAASAAGGGTKAGVAPDEAVLALGVFFAFHKHPVHDTELKHAVVAVLQSLQKVTRAKAVLEGMKLGLPSYSVLFGVQQTRLLSNSIQIEVDEIAEAFPDWPLKFGKPEIRELELAWWGQSSRSAARTPQIQVSPPPSTVSQQDSLPPSTPSLSSTSTGTRGPVFLVLIAPPRRTLRVQPRLRLGSIPLRMQRQQARQQGGFVGGGVAEADVAGFQGGAGVVVEGVPRLAVGG